MHFTLRQSLTRDGSQTSGQSDALKNVTLASLRGLSVEFFFFSSAQFIAFVFVARASVSSVYVGRDQDGRLGCSRVSLPAKSQRNARV